MSVRSPIVMESVISESVLTDRTGPVPIVPLVTSPSSSSSSSSGLDSTVAVSSLSLPSSSVRNETTTDHVSSPSPSAVSSVPFISTASTTVSDSSSLLPTNSILGMLTSTPRTFIASSTSTSVASSSLLHPSTSLSPTVNPPLSTASSLRTFSSFSGLSATSSSSSSSRTPQPSDFILLRVIGRGAFGKVLQVAHRGSGRIYALKVYSKTFLADHGQLEYTVTERTVMTRLRHPYIVNLRYAFQTSDRLFLISDYCAGGELFRSLRKQGLMLEDAAKVYLAEVVLAIEHMHNQGVIHRDLKPENILLDGDGHVKLTDYGLAKDLHLGMNRTKSETNLHNLAHGNGNGGGGSSNSSSNETSSVTVPETTVTDDDGDSVRTKSLVGTDEYLAPEMINASNAIAKGILPKPDNFVHTPTAGYGKSVDFWALGALAYEMMTGEPPFRDRNKKELYRKILSDKVTFPRYLSPAAVSLIKGLLERNIDKRLGCGKSTMFEIRGIQGLKNHVFFKGIDWNALNNRTVPAPMKPEVSSATDYRYFDPYFTSMPLTLDLGDEKAHAEALLAVQLQQQGGGPKKKQHQQQQQPPQGPVNTKGDTVKTNEKTGESSTPMTMVPSSQVSTVPSTAEPVSSSASTTTVATTTVAIPISTTAASKRTSINNEKTTIPTRTLSGNPTSTTVPSSTVVPSHRLSSKSQHYHHPNSQHHHSAVPRPREQLGQGGIHSPSLQPLSVINQSLNGSQSPSLVPQRLSVPKSPLHSHTMVPHSSSVATGLPYASPTLAGFANVGNGTHNPNTTLPPPLSLLPPVLELDGPVSSPATEGKDGFSTDPNTSSYPSSSSSSSSSIPNETVDPFYIEGFAWVCPDVEEEMQALIERDQQHHQRQSNVSRTTTMRTSSTPSESLVTSPNSTTTTDGGLPHGTVTETPLLAQNTHITHHITNELTISLGSLVGPSTSSSSSFSSSSLSSSSSTVNGSLLQTEAGTALASDDGFLVLQNIETSEVLLQNMQNTLQQNKQNNTHHTNTNESTGKKKKTKNKTNATAGNGTVTTKETKGEEKNDEDTTTKNKETEGQGLVENTTVSADKASVSSSSSSSLPQPSPSSHVPPPPLLSVVNIDSVVPLLSLLTTGTTNPTTHAIASTKNNVPSHVPWSTTTDTTGTTNSSSTVNVPKTNPNVTPSSSLAVPSTGSVTTINIGKPTGVPSPVAPAPYKPPPPGSWAARALGIGKGAGTIPSGTVVTHETGNSSTTTTTPTTVTVPVTLPIPLEATPMVPTSTAVLTGGGTHSMGTSTNGYSRRIPLPNNGVPLTTTPPLPSSASSSSVASVPASSSSTSSSLPVTNTSSSFNVTSVHDFPTLGGSTNGSSNSNNTNSSSTGTMNSNTTSSVSNHPVAKVLSSSLPLNKASPWGKPNTLVTSSSNNNSSTLPTTTTGTTTTVSPSLSTVTTTTTTNGNTVPNSTLSTSGTVPITMTTPAVTDTSTSVISSSTVPVSVLGSTTTTSSSSSTTTTPIPHKPLGVWGTQPSFLRANPVTVVSGSSTGTEKQELPSTTTVSPLRKPLALDPTVSEWVPVWKK